MSPICPIASRSGSRSCSRHSRRCATGYPESDEGALLKEIKGVITAMATPFGASGGVDHDAARRLAAHLLEHGSHGLAIAGSTGECPTLTDDEEIELLRAVRAEVGDEVPLVCGTGTNDTRHSCELTHRA